MPMRASEVRSIVCDISLSLLQKNNSSHSGGKLTGRQLKIQVRMIFHSSVTLNGNFHRC